MQEHLICSWQCLGDHEVQGIKLRASHMPSRRKLLLAISPGPNLPCGHAVQRRGRWGGGWTLPAHDDVGSLTLKSCLFLVEGTLMSLAYLAIQTRTSRGLISVIAAATGHALYQFSGTSWEKSSWTSTVVFTALEFVGFHCHRFLLAPCSADFRWVLGTCS